MFFEGSKHMELKYWTLYQSACLYLLKDSQEFLLFLLNELHEELKLVRWSDARDKSPAGDHPPGGDHPPADNQAERSLSDAEDGACDSARGSDVVLSDDSSSHSSADADDVQQVCKLVFLLYSYL